jgi:hypothetical protein
MQHSHVTCLAMDCDEHSLRQMLASALGASVVHSILNAIVRGERTKILLADGKVIVLSDVEEALRILHEKFGWTASNPRPNPAFPPLSLFGSGGLSLDDRTAVHVLDMCHRLEQEFTLKELVARILDERPDMIVEFAEAWGRLIQNKLIRLCKGARPCTYVVAMRSPGSV